MVNDTRCTIREIKKVLQNILYVNHVDYGSDEDVKVLGLVSKLKGSIEKQFIIHDIISEFHSVWI